MRGMGEGIEGYKERMNKFRKQVRNDIFKTGF
jgi:hypothetical protein